MIDISFDGTGLDFTFDLSMQDNLESSYFRKNKFSIFQFKTRLWICETIIPIPPLKPGITEAIKEILETSIHSFQDVLEYLRVDFILKIGF